MFSIIFYLIFFLLFLSILVLMAVGLCIGMAYLMAYFLPGLGLSNVLVPAAIISILVIVLLANGIKLLFINNKAGQSLYRFNEGGDDDYYEEEEEDEEPELPRVIPTKPSPKKSKWR